MAAPKGDSADWRKLADQKEKEWRGLLESRIESLESLLQDKEKEVAKEQSKFVELKDNFKYNLKLLADRDRELEKYDASFLEVRNVLNSKNAEISELNIHIDDLKNVVKREAKMRDELQASYQRRLREKQAEVDSYKSSKDNEVQDQRKEYEQFRRNLQQQLVSVQSELDTQRRELTTEFDAAMKKREHELRVQCDDLSAKYLEQELKSKLLEKELELSRESGDKTTAMAQEAETSQRELEKQLKHKEWELADAAAVKDSQISELENKLASNEASMKRMQEDFQRKYTEMDRTVRDKEESLERARNGFLEREQFLQQSVQELQGKLEDAQIREKKRAWEHQDEMKDKNVQIEKLTEEVKDTQERWERHVSEISRQHATQDLELNNAKEEERRLRQELDQRKADIARYKRELKAATDREENLDKAKTQAELDWQKRCEQLETQQYDKSEDLIKSLTTARNEAQALVRERERELRHKVLLVKSLHREKDQLRVLLKKHQIPLDNFTKFSLEESEEEEQDAYMDDLQRQNSELKQLIAQMRLQMESLGQENALTSSKERDATSELQERVSELRDENKDLQQQLKAAKLAPSVGDQKPPPELGNEKDILKQVEGSTAVKSHILALNGVIGSLRSEKVELAASVKKQQTRIAFLEKSLEEISTQPRQKQIQIDQLNYELSASKRRHETEVSGLKSRVSELELQVAESRREADEYHRASLERNEELVALGNQLSALKMEMSEANPSINFGAQELYIQQLQNELSQLRKRALALEGGDGLSFPGKQDSSGDDASRGGAGGDGGDLGVGGSSSELKRKLKSAATKIVQLATENQQLMESNNRLRAELKTALSSQPLEKGKEGIESSAGFEDRESASSERPEDSQRARSKDDFNNRLSQLEKLQYNLTRQELQFAGRFKPGTTEDSMKTTDGFYQSQDFSNVPEKENGIIQDPTHRYQSYSTEADQRAVSSCRPWSRSRRDLDPQMLMSMSSGGGESIQKVWQMLEDSLTSGDHGRMSPRSEMSAPAGISQAKRADNSTFQLHGKRPTTGKTKPSSREIAKNYAEGVRKLAQVKPKVRNYNIRDDHGVR